MYRLCIDISRFNIKNWLLFYGLWFWDMIDTVHPSQKSVFLTFFSDKKELTKTISYIVSFSFLWGTKSTLNWKATPPDLRITHDGRTRLLYVRNSLTYSHLDDDVDTTTTRQNLLEYTLRYRPHLTKSTLDVTVSRVRISTYWYSFNIIVKQKPGPTFVNDMICIVACILEGSVLQTYILIFIVSLAINC